MTNEKHNIIKRVDALNTELLAIRQFKNNNPETRTAFYRTIPGSILNAYREGDIGFTECLDLLQQAFKNQETQL